MGLLPGERVAVLRAGPRATASGSPRRPSRSRRGLAPAPYARKPRFRDGGHSLSAAVPRSTGRVFRHPRDFEPTEAVASTSERIDRQRDVPAGAKSVTYGRAERFGGFGLQRGAVSLRAERVQCVLLLL